MRRQDVKPLYYLEGSIYISKTSVLLKKKTFYHEKTQAYKVDKWKSLEIDDIEQETIICKQICSRQLKDKIINYIYYYSMMMLLASAITIITTIILLAGRMVTMIFKIGPNDYWCETLGEHHFGHFVGYGILGAILGFFIIILR